jgi:hypothetical protein
MKKKLWLMLLVGLPGVSFGQAALGDVIGTVILAKEQTAVYNAKVKTESNGTVYQTRTDEDGRFRISGIPAGTYMFQVIFEGDTLKDQKGVVPIDGIFNFGKIQFRKTIETGPVIITHDTGRMRLSYGVTPEIKMSSEDVAQSAVRFDPSAMLASMSSDIKVTDDGDLSFRGSRKGDMIYLIDGVKMTEVTSIPSAAIGGMMVYTGGVPAKYGDTNGGVVVMETKSYFDLYRAWYSVQLKKGLQ